jgi:hypothetical protein
VVIIRDVEMVEEGKGKEGKEGLGRGVSGIGSNGMMMKQ